MNYSGFPNKQDEFSSVSLFPDRMQYGMLQQSIPPSSEEGGMGSSAAMTPVALVFWFHCRIFSQIRSIFPPMFRFPQGTRVPGGFHSFPIR